MKKILIIIAIINSILVGQVATITAQEVEYSTINDSKNNTVQIELSQLPTKLLDDLANVGVKIKVDDNFLKDNNFLYNGRYTYNTKTITLDGSEHSINDALYHEIGHALDDLYILHEDDDIIKSFEEGEFYFGNGNYYNDNILEYVAEGISHYYEGDLYQNTILYRALDNYLSYYTEI